MSQLVRNVVINPQSHSFNSAFIHEIKSSSNPHIQNCETLHKRTSISKGPFQF